MRSAPPAKFVRPAGEENEASMRLLRLERSEFFRELLGRGGD